MSSYTVVGAGAIGGTLAHALTTAGHDVTVVDTDAAHVEAIREHGLALRRDPVGREDGPLDVVRVAAAHTPDDAPDGPLGRVLLAVKSQHTTTAARWIAPRLAADGVVVSVQNGHNEDAVAAEVGPERVLGSFVNIFADWAGPGVIRDGGPGALVVGLPAGGPPDARVLEIAEDLRAYPGATVTRATANLPGYRWGKRAFGAVLGLTTLVDAPMAAVVDEFRDVAAAVAAEPTAVAIAEGITIEAFDAYEPYAFAPGAPDRVREAALDRLVAWLWTQPKDRSGVFRDIAVRRRPREAHGGNDTYAALAARHGVPTPLGAAVAARLGAIEAGTAEFSPTHLTELRELLTRTARTPR